MATTSNRIHDTATRKRTSTDGATRLELQVFGAAGHRRWPLPTRGKVVIGRSASAEVCVADTSVSRNHAAIHCGTQLSVEDLGSANGTAIRGRRLGRGERVTIGIGDLIEIGAIIAVVQPAHAGDEPRAARTNAEALDGAAASPAVVILDESMKCLYRLVERVARSTISVLLLGETGAGKEVIAEAVHRASPRAAEPLLRLNCGALAESLVESELFGHARGAFTGAATDKVGLLEAAHKGTVFLDEVGELSPSLQVRLLRVLEEGQVRRVGDVASRSLDVRYISATNRDLRSEIARGRFREDLYFRLSGVSIAVPPLRERRSELAPLARAFVEAAAAKDGRSAPPISPEAIAALARHPWPGNLRELRNVMERAVLLCDDRIEPEHLALETPPAERPAPASARAPASGRAPGSRRSPSSGRAALAEDVSALERRRILDALERCGGSQTQAAKLLGISRSKLLARLDAYEVPRPRKPRGRRS